MAPANDPKTGAPSGGVDADIKRLTQEGDAPHAPDHGFTNAFNSTWGDYATHPSVDQYRSSSLIGLEGEREEYLVFAANTASICSVETGDAEVTKGTAKIPRKGDQLCLTDALSLFQTLIDAGISLLDVDEVKPYFEKIEGTLSFVDGNDVVTGVGTDFESQLKVGSDIQFKEGSKFYSVTIAEIVSINELILEEPFSAQLEEDDDLEEDPDAEGEALAVVTSDAKFFKPFTASEKLVLIDNGGRSISGVKYIKVRRGDVEQDDDHIIKLTVAAGDLEMPDPTSGIVYIKDTETNRNRFEPWEGYVPGLSRDRGDQVLEVGYYLTPPKFYWTRNDPLKERFGWDGKAQRWSPFKGGSIKNLGPLENPTLTLSPRPKNLEVGDYLAGTQVPDSVAVLRLGGKPDAGSYALGDDTSADPYNGFRGVLVCPDKVVDDDEYDFSTLDPSPIAVLAKDSGKLRWNPAVFSQYAGQLVWYVFDSFDPKSKGVVGKIANSDIEPLFICPIPSPTDRPLLRIGSRRWLDVLYADNDAELVSLTPATKQVAISLSTGKVKLSEDDITKAKMGPVEAPNPNFNPLWLGATLFYDGVSMCRHPQPLRPPAKLSDSFVTKDGHEVPLAIPVPGLGVSGVRLVEDKTGRDPDFSKDISRRAEGSGVKRQPFGMGDTFVFTPNKPWESLVRKTGRKFAEDKPNSQTVFIKWGTNESPSAIKFHRRATKKPRLGKPLYFQNTVFTPSFYAADGKMFSRKDGPYSFHGDEVFRVIFGGALPYFEWSSSSLMNFSKDPISFTAQEVADSLNAKIVEMGFDSDGYGASFVQNRLYLYGSGDTVDIEILPGISGDKDFSGSAVLGFNPYWKVKLPVSPEIEKTGMDVNWTPDTGSSLGLKRSPYNKNASKAIPDFRDQQRVEEAFLSTIQASPFVYLQSPPLEDVAGVDEGVFFEVQDGPYRLPMKHMDNIYCDFGAGYFRWLDDKTHAFRSKTPVSTVSLGNSGIIPESLHPAVNGYFFEREPGGEEGFRLKEEGENFVFVNEGQTGTLILTRQIGEQLYRGSKGEFTEGENLLVDTTEGLNFQTIVENGNRLKVLTGDSAGSYIIQGVLENALVVYPNFPSGSNGVVSYELYDLEPIDNMDDQVAADFVYKRFNHLPEETFTIHLLSPIAEVGSWSEAPRYASVSRDFARNRSVSLRVGLKKKNDEDLFELPVRWLKKFELGDLANGSLFVDGNLFDDDSHFPQADEPQSSWAFQLRISTLVVDSSEIVLVPTTADYSEDPVGVEMAEDTFELKFGSSILDTYGQSTVVFEEAFRSSVEMEQNTVEVNPDTGQVQISQNVLSFPDFQNETVYWVARMVTEDQTDVFLNPMIGAFMFREPLDEFQIVEAGYWTTDSAGARLTETENDVVSILPERVEFIPLIIRAEECVRLSDTLYEFNPTDRTIRQDINPVIYVGPQQANIPGSTVAAFIDYENNRIELSFLTPGADDPLVREESFPGSGFAPSAGNPLRMYDVRGSKVTITYGVLESFGGEMSYTVAAPPVWRPPFAIEGGVNSFELDGMRTADIYAGQLMRLGAFLFYVKSVEYDAENRKTLVSFFPKSPSTGAGSRSPGNDAFSAITEYPIARVVDPFDPVVVSETPSGNLQRTTDSSAHGFLVPIEERVVFGKEDTTPIDVFFEPTPKGRSEVIFFINLMRFVGLGYIMEIGGSPYTITGMKLSDDGTRTTVSVTPPLNQGIVWGEVSVLVSFRPIYPPGPITYVGQGKPFLDREAKDLVLWGELSPKGDVLPGRSLAPVQEYNADPQNGDITFQHPFQEYLQSDQRLTFSRVEIRVLSPRISNGYPELPAFKVKYKHVISPSEENGLLESSLLGTFSYRAIDSFYYRSLPLLDWSGETAIRILKEAQAKASSYGVSTGGMSEDNWEFGRVGIPVEKRNLYDRDRAARAYLGYYNSVVVGFEQIDEAATGRVVGDRDGKFKFFVGKGLDYTAKGFENPVTGILNPSYAYGRAFASLLPDGVDIIADEDDVIVSPFDCSVDDDYDLEGEFPESEIRKILFESQNNFIKNDIDDRVMTSYRVVRVSGFPFFNLRIKGKVKSMDDKHEFSRLFSTQADYFTTTYPGATAKTPENDFGIYSFWKKHKGRWRSTWKDTIGFVENPVLGNITNLSDVDMRERLQRARVYEFSPVGFPDLDEDLFADGVEDDNSFTKKPRPAAIASVLPLEDFPLRNGKPDFDVMATNQNSPSGDATPDLNSGAFEEHTPPWQVGIPLQFGHPDGTFVLPKYDETVSMFGEDAYRDVYVGEILNGCVMTFAYKDDDGDLQTITNGDLIIDTANDPPTPITLKRADTLLKMVGGGVIKIEEDEIDPNTLSEYAELLPSFRVGLDVGVVRKSGRIRDLTLPSWSDPMIGFRELIGQRPIKPFTRVEGQVEFSNSDVTPTFIPALLGGAKNDSGDYTLPYMKSSDTELMRLREAQSEIMKILQQDGPAGLATHDWLSVYPDEHLHLTYPEGSEGLFVAADLQPVKTEGSYNQGTGIGDLREGDLMILETSNSNTPIGMQGFLSVGSIDAYGEDADITTVIGLPRFITPTLAATDVDPASKITYSIDNLTAVVADFSGNEEGIWREDQAGVVNPYGSQGVKITEIQVNGPDPLIPHEGGYTQTEIIFNSLMFDVDDGSASIPDEIDLGSGYYDPANLDEGGALLPLYSTGGLNSVLAGAGVDTSLYINLLKRADIQQDADGINYVEPVVGEDGRVKLSLKLVKTVVGDDIDNIATDPALVAHRFELLYSLFPNDAVPGATETVKIPSNGIWFYTSIEPNKPSRMVIKTLHPEDPRQYPDPFPVGHPNEGDPNPDSNPDAVSSWFPWDEYTHLDTEDPTDEDEDQVIRFRETFGFDEENESVFADTYEEFAVSIDVVDGQHSHIKSDRLTFQTLIDTRQGYPRKDEEGNPPVHPYGVDGLGDPLALSLSFSVPYVDIRLFDEKATSPNFQTYVWHKSNVNAPDSVNGGEPFTFMPRSTYQTDPDTLRGVGYWSDGVGELKVMGLEGHENKEVVFSDVQMLTAIPSSDLCPTGLILDPVSAVGSMSSCFQDDPANAPTETLFHQQIAPLIDDLALPQDHDNVSFNCDKVEKNDVVYVTGGVDGAGSTKVGTYLVKYALQPFGENLTPPNDLAAPDPATQEAPIRPVAEMKHVCMLGSNGYMGLWLPNISGLKWVRDPEEFRLYVDGLNYNDEFPTTSKTGFKDNGFIFVLVTNPREDLLGEDFERAVYKIGYTELDVSDPDNPYFVLDISTVRNAVGTLQAPLDAKNLLFGTSFAADAEILDWWSAQDAAAGDEVTEYNDSVVANPSTFISKEITGASYYTIDLKHFQTTKFPEQRYVGYNWNTTSYPNIASATDQAAYGVVQVGLSSTKFPANYGGDSSDPSWVPTIYWTAKGTGEGSILPETGAAVANNLYVQKRTPHTAGAFQEDEHATAFDNIPSYLDVSNYDFTALNKNSDGEGELDCLLPGIGINLTFWAETGIFLERNFPKPTFDLLRAKRSIICDESENGELPGYDLDPEDVGERVTLEFIEEPDFQFSEHVSFHIRRTRRWHDILLGLSDAMAALRFPYETRKGVVETYTPGSMFHKIKLAGEGTQLGALNNPDVNVNPGDIVRVFDPDTKEMKCWGEISNILNETEARIGPPGFIGEDDPEPNDLVEIYLNKAPVPHEQSNEQLFELATEELVFERKAAMQTPENGFPASGGIVKWDDTEVAEDEFGEKPKDQVYLASANYLTDTNAGTEEGMINFLAEGVKKDDYLIIDPAGALIGPTGYPENADEDRPEEGDRPFGDLGAVKTQDDFYPGRPSEFDDNRGYYKILQVEQTRLLVSPNRDGESEFIGETNTSNTMNALHGGLTPETQEFALYPTIHGSILTGVLNEEGFAGEEGQGDLRPTAFGGEDILNPGSPDVPENSFSGNPFSVGPFSYRIIRPTRLLSDDTVELILFHRERILSLMENFESAMKQDKKGNYWEFQRYRHSFDLGIPTIPDTGLGVPRNAYLYDLGGQFMVSPFLNDTDCLSVLDRRVILEDILLDREQPPFSAPEDPFYTKFGDGDGLPLLLGRIDQTLNKSDRIRQKRLAWLYLRTTKTDGTLAQIRNWGSILAERLREQERLRRLQESTGG